MKGLTIRDIYESFSLVTNSHDVEMINKEHETAFNGFYVRQDLGELIFIYGFFGSLPYLHKRVYEVKGEY